MVDRRVIVEARFEFGQFSDAGGSSSSSFVAPPAPVVQESDRVIRSLGRSEYEDGDRLSPVTRRRAPDEPVMRPPTHRRGYEGPTTPKTSPSPVTPSPRTRSPEQQRERLVPIRQSSPRAPRKEISPYDFGRGAAPALPSEPAKREIGPHDFVNGLKPRAPLGGIRVPPHAQRGSGHNMVLNRGRVFLPPTGTPAEWEAAVEKRRRDFAEQMASRMPGRGPRTRAAAARPNEFFTGENARALKESAARLGLPPEHLAQVIAHETIGSFSPRKWGGKGGRYMGLIQFGPRERREYGVHAGQTFREQLGSAERFLIGRGYRPGMGQMDLYSTVLAGRPGLYHRRDRNGSVAQHVERMRKIWGPQVERFLASGSGSTPNTVAAGATPRGVTPQTSTAGR